MFQAILAMIKHLKWHQLVVVHDNDIYNTRLTHLLVQLATANNEICILSITQYKYMERVNHDIDENINSPNKNIIQSVFSGNNYEIPILILMKQTYIQNFLKSLKNDINPNNTSPIQIFFSNLLSHDDIKFMPKQVTKFYSISIKTDQLHSFEEYWQDRIRYIKVNEHFFTLVCRLYYLYTVLLIPKYFGHHVVNTNFPNHYIPFFHNKYNSTFLALHLRTDNIMQAVTDT
jgi:hypothetical protein